MKVYDLLEMKKEHIICDWIKFRGYFWYWSYKFNDYFTSINGETEWFSERYNIFSILEQDITSFKANNCITYTREK